MIVFTDKSVIIAIIILNMIGGPMFLIRTTMYTDKGYAIRFSKKGSNLDELDEIKYCVAEIAQRFEFSEHNIRNSLAVYKRLLEI